MKFGRIYSMLVQGETKNWKIDFPLTCRFQVQNDSTYTCGSASFQIFNLSEDARNDIYQDIFQLNDYRQIKFSAGYQGEGNSIPMIFKGNVYQAYSYRQGPDWVTEIQAMDGGNAVGRSIAKVPLSNTYTFKYAIRKLMESLSPTVTIGKLGDLELTPIGNSRGMTLSGNSWDLIRRYCYKRDLLAYIYQEKVNVVRKDEYIDEHGALEKISAETGMIGSPRMQNGQVTVKMLFEPRIHPFQSIALEVKEARMSNPYYTVFRITHRGTISGAVCEDLTTDVTLYDCGRTRRKIL